MAVMGPPEGLSKRWKLSFRADEGTPGLAKQRVDKIMQSLKHADGAYRDLVVETPSRVQAKVFLNRDQSLQQGAIERAIKKLRGAVQAVLPDKDVRISKYEGVCNIEWRPIIKVEAPKKNDIQLKWHYPSMEVVGVTAEDKIKIQQQFAVANGTVPREQWTV